MRMTRRMATYNSESGSFACTYTGEFTLTGSLSGDFELRLLTSGTLTIVSAMNVDVCLVGGGQAGQDAYNSGVFNKGGVGGQGGGMNNVYNIKPAANSYAIVIGAGGASKKAVGGNTTAFGYTAVGGGVSGCNGGAGNDFNSSVSGADGIGKPGNAAFGGTEYFGGGGGCGSTYNRNDDYYTTGNQAGGLGGGAAGDTAASANTGGGGGGGKGYKYPYDDNPTWGIGPGRSGGSGIVIIRNKR